MSDRRRVKSDPNGGELMSASIAAREAFALLNAGTRKHYRGRGDTATAARDRAAREAGITPAQAERVWKRWQEMKAVNGDVYRSLRNTYGHLCSWIEGTADKLEQQRREIEGTNETDAGRMPIGTGLVGASAREEKQG